MKRSLITGILAGVMSFLPFAGVVGEVSASEFSYPWNKSNSSIVLDAYEYTPIDWTKMSNNTRLAGFINKASDGIAPKSRCGSNVLCRVKWRRYAATQELYNTRKVLAKTLGMKWGAYHLARPGNPIKQAEHFLTFTKPEKDDLLALDIEHNDPRKWMSLSDAEIFAKHIKMRTGRYPILYTNHSTSRFIAANRDKYKLLSRLNLWYARYKPNVQGVFPMGNWESYTIWQFSSMVNCDNKSCLRRINGAGNWIDVNVVAMSPEKLKREWPFAKLWAKKPLPVKPAPSDLIASAEVQELLPQDQAIKAIESIAAPVATVEEAKETKEITVAFTNYFPESNSVAQPLEHAVDPEEAKRMWIRSPITPSWRPGAKFADKSSQNLGAKTKNVSKIEVPYLGYKNAFEIPAFVAEQVVFDQTLTTGSVKTPGSL